MNDNKSDNPPLRVSEIAKILGGDLAGNGTAEIYRVASLDKAQENEISFVEKEDSELETNASCLIVSEKFSKETAQPQIKVKNPKLAFAKIAEILHPFNWQTGWHQTAIIHQTADVRASFIGAFSTIGEESNIGEASQIFEGVRIGRNVSIGKCSIIHPNCVIYDNVSIGDDCVVHAGTIIGADGFGYVRNGAEGYLKFPQIGTVSIEDNVEIGANCCIDRGALGTTRIGKGTKLDNLVQIAHNVDIGERVVIAAQTGISGSTVIEDDCVIGGQVGFGDHARVLKGAIIGSKAGILPGKIVREGVWWGVPVQPLDEYKRQNAMVKGLSRMREEIKELKRLLTSLGNK